MYRERLEKAKARYTARLGKKQLLEEQKQAAEAKLSTAQDSLGTYEKVSLLLQKTSEYSRLQAKTRIEEIVSSALNAVFDDLYSFRVAIITRAGRVEADYSLAKNGLEVKLEKPDFGKGGGVIDVVTLALRLSIIELTDCKGMVLLDEIGKMVSAEYRQPVAEFLKTYSEQFGRQLLLITHATEIADVADKSFSVTQRDGKSEVKE